PSRPGTRNSARQRAENRRAANARNLCPAGASMCAGPWCVSPRRGRTVEDFLADVRFAWRGLRRSPGVAVAAILTLALGMGATTAIFSVIRAVLMSPLPYAQPERRVMVWSRWKDFPKTWVAVGEVADYRRAIPSFASVAAWEIDQANLTGGG